MSAQAAIAAKVLISAISFTGTALSITPRGRDAKGVLNWVAPGATILDDTLVDFSYRPPASGRKTVKSMLRVFSPKTFTDSTTSVVSKIGDNSASIDFTFLENASAAEKLRVLDILLSTIGSAEFRTALSTGDVMY